MYTAITKRTYLRRLTALVTASFFFLSIFTSDVFCLSADPSGSDRAALAPPLATKPSCEIVRNPDGSFDVITNNDVISSWDKETVRSVRANETLGAAFRNRWAFVDVSYLIAQMLKLTQEHKLQRPKEILIPLIKKHIRNRQGEAEILLEGYDIDNTEEVKRGEQVVGFSLPVKRNGETEYRLIYNLTSGDTAIPMSDGTTVYVKAETDTQEIRVDKSVYQELLRILELLRHKGKVSERDIAFVKVWCGHYGYIYLDSLDEEKIKDIVPMLLVLADIDTKKDKTRTSEERLVSATFLFADEAIRHEYKNTLYGLNLCLRRIGEDIKENEAIQTLSKRRQDASRQLSLAQNIFANFTLSDKPQIASAVTRLLADSGEEVMRIAQEFVELLRMQQQKYSKQIRDIENWLEGIRSFTSLLLSIRQTLLTPNALAEHQLNEALTNVTEATLRGNVRAGYYGLKLNLDKGIPALRLYPDMWFVWSNLCTNARDAIFEKDRQSGWKHEGGEITITSKYDIANKAVVVTIADTGIGISNEVISRIWEKGFTTKEGGSGQGLAIVREVVRRNGGTISVESDPGKGTTFTIRLPIHSQDRKYNNEKRQRASSSLHNTGSVPLAFDLMNAILGVNHEPLVKEDFNLMITYKCPFDCGHCLARLARNKGKGRDVPKQRLYSILDQFRGFKKIHIVGTGEPMAYGTWQDFVDVITYATERIDEVRIVTNGYRIPETFDEAEAFFKQIPPDALKKVVWVLSVDKYHEKQMLSRMKKSLTKIVNVMEQLADKGVIRTAYNVRVSDSHDEGEALKHFGLVGKNTRDSENVFVNTLIGQGYAGGNSNMGAHSLKERDVASHNNSTEKVFLFIDPEGFIVTSDHFAYMTHEERGESPLNKHSVIGKVQNDTLEIGRAIIKRLFGRNLAYLNVDGSYNDFQIEVFCRKFFKDNLSKYKSKSARKKLEKKLVVSIIDTLSALYYYHAGDVDTARRYMVKVSSRGSKIKTAMLKLIKFLSSKLEYIDDKGFVENCVKVSSVKVPDAKSPSMTTSSSALDPLSENIYEAKDTTATPETLSSESERIHATNFQDTVNFIQAQPQTRPLIVALGTSWIKGYEKGRYIQYDALNPLICSIRTYCESKGIPFIIDDDGKLLARINTERAKEGKTNAKVVVLASENTVKSDNFATLRNDEKNAFVVGVNSQELTVDSYMRIMEMLTMALKLSAGLEVTQDSTPITITKDDKYKIYIFIPHAEPMDYEQLKMIYEVQKFA